MSKVHLHEIQSLRSSVSKKVQLFQNNLFQFFTPPLHPAPFTPSHKCLKTGLFLAGHQQQRQDSSSRIEVLPSTEEGAGAGRASQPVPASPDSSTSNLDPPTPYYLDPPVPPTAPPPPTPTTTSTPPLSTLDQQGGQLVINSFKTILLSLVSDSTMYNKIWLVLGSRILGLGQQAISLHLEAKKCARILFGRTCIAYVYSCRYVPSKPS